MQPRALVDYKVLRRINPQAARCAVLEYLTACGRNVAETARTVGITRPVVPGSPDFASRVLGDAKPLLRAMACRFGAILKVVGPLGLEPRTPGLRGRHRLANCYQIRERQRLATSS